MQISDFQKVSQLFSEQNQYKIPRYQRRYVWNMDNWETLWQDITQLTENSSDTHFAGTIMMYREEKGKVTEIIDGQQRLTTFQIILCVIRDLWESKKYEDDVDNEVKNDIEGRLCLLGGLTLMGSIGRTDSSNPYRLIHSSLDVEDFDLVVSRKLWNKEISDGTTDVLQAFDSLFKKGSNENGKQSEQHLIVAAYGYFGKKIVEYLENRCLSELVNLFFAFTDRFVVIKVTIESGGRYDPERIFQTINDTGRMLTDFDYLRNYLFLRTRKQLKAQPIDKLYDQHWNRFEKWNDRKLEHFFQAYLKAKLGPGCFKGENKNIKPFDCYRKHIKTLEGPDDNFFIPLLELSRYANSYDELDNSGKIDEDPQKLSNRMRFYDDLKLPRLDWFLLFMKHAPELSDSGLLEQPNNENNENMDNLLRLYQRKPEEHTQGLSDTDLSNLCDILESYIVRRCLCYRKYETSYNEINNFFSMFSDCPQSVNVEELVNHLSGSWPNPEEVSKVLTQQTYNVFNIVLVRYILYRIELNIGKNSALCFDSKSELKQIEAGVNLTIVNMRSGTPRSKISCARGGIQKRTEKFLENFDQIWTPNAADYLGT